VWARFKHRSLAGLLERSGRYVAAARLRAAARFESAPPRRLLPAGWSVAAALLLRKEIGKAHGEVEKPDQTG